MPGTPIKLSKPLIDFFVKFFTIFPSITPEPIVASRFLFIVKFLNVFLRQITIPLKPLSLTNKLEPEPIKKTLILLMEEYFNIFFKSVLFSGYI